jgi:membrane protease subunit HflC
MNILKSSILLLAVLIAIVLFSSFFTVQEGQQALLLRFGKMRTNVENSEQAQVFRPGLHFKWPFIEDARVFDSRIQTADMKASRIVTAKKKYVIVDYYVKWRISNLALFFKSTNGNLRQADGLLQAQLNDGLRAQFGKRTIPEVVTNDRTKIMKKLLQKAEAGAKSLGIDVVDVRIKRIELPETVTNTVYQQMRAEREQVANQHRFEGRAQAQAIRARADAQAVVIKAQAISKASQVRAKGSAEAAKIYGQAYGKDPAFYRFYRSLLAYKNAFGHKHDVLVLKPDSQFFNYFNHAQGSKKKAA